MVFKISQRILFFLEKDLLSSHLKTYRHHLKPAWPYFQYLFSKNERTLLVSVSRRAWCYYHYNNKKLDKLQIHNFPLTH